jgi:isopentenyl phosphate kinase
MKIDHNNYQIVNKSVSKAATVDVTGGMRTKLELMWKLCLSFPNLMIDFSHSDEVTSLQDIILGKQTGTRMKY